VDADRTSVTHQSCKKDGEQSSWLNAMVGDCLCYVAGSRDQRSHLLTTAGKKLI